MDGGRERSRAASFIIPTLPPGRRRRREASTEDRIRGGDDLDARAARWGLTFVRQVEGLRLNFQHVGAREAHSRPGSHHRFSRHLCFRAPDRARLAPAAHCVLPLAPLPSSAKLEITVTVPAASEPATAMALLAYPWRAPSRFDNTLCRFERETGGRYMTRLKARHLSSGAGGQPLGSPGQAHP